MTTAAVDALHGASTVILRTERHPAAVAVPSASTCDDLYESAERIGDVYRAIVERVVGAAADRPGEGAVVYAVPGSPLVAEHTVELLLADDRVDVRIVPALSFVDLAWTRLGVDPFAEGPRIVDGHRFAVDAAGERGPLLVGQCDTTEVLSDIKLAVDDPPDTPVVVLQRLGLEDESIREVAWTDLDRLVDPDHLTSVWIPRLSAPISGEMAAFAQLTRDLRTGCPWDRKQTHDSLKRYLLEETYEVLEAIDAFDPTTGEGAEELSEELGDLLFQLVLHATIAAEEGWFDFVDVIRGVHDKLYARHPHVFGGVEMASADDVAEMWERNKRAEKSRSSAMDGIPAALPALARAMKVQRKAANLGIDVHTGLAEGSAGGRLWGLVAALTEGGFDAEDELRRATDRFVERFREVEHRDTD
jgi:tetrapyrrole methylase family protein/MazG family protein